MIPRLPGDCFRVGAPRRLSRAVLLLLLAGCAAAPVGTAGGGEDGAARTVAGGDIADAIRARDWPLAARDASDGTDDLAGRLVTYLRLLAPDPSPAAIADFLAAEPVWPNRALLAARYDAALGRDRDDAVRTLCARRRPEAARALARCADARAEAGDAAPAGADARDAWIAGLDGGPGDAAAAASFRARWSTALGPDADWARFRFLADDGATASDAAARTAAVLTGTRGAIARARLLLGSGHAPDPVSLRNAVPVDGRDDPFLVLAVAAALRRDGDLAGAARFWATDAGRVEAGAAAAPLRARDWAERDRLAHALLLAGDGADAFAVADDPSALPDAAAAERLFLAGFIALAVLDRPDIAESRFDALSTAGASLITRARAFYWLGRVAARRGNDAGARRCWAKAADAPTTFYGQAALARLRQAGDPGPGLAARLDAAAAAHPTDAGAPLRFAGETLPRAAILLTAWGERRRARAFLDLADRRTTDGPTHALAARLSLALGLPDEAVAIARRAGRDGIALPALGWPDAVTPPPGVPAPLVLGIVRQESGFDTAARSGSGALGLMQLLPGTAAELARAAGVPAAPGALPALLIEDPSLNLRLGTAYLAALLARFGGDVPLAVAAYNAGPHRASTWPPPPRPDGDDPGTDDPSVDWIERIPVAETRNYVERVLENRSIYAVRDGTGGALAFARPDAAP